jgi:hypothetical protein
MESTMQSQHVLCLVVAILVASKPITAFAPTQSTYASNKPTRLFAEFNEAVYETDRLAKDAEAMSAMKQQAENEYSKLRTPWKWRIRKAVWDYLEEENIAQFPR